MRSTRTISSLFVLVTLLSLSSAEELDPANVPAACRTICQPIVTLTGICDVDGPPRPPPPPNSPPSPSPPNDEDDEDEDGEEEAERQCVCTNNSFNVRNVAALCAACMTQNGRRAGVNCEIFFPSLLSFSFLFFFLLD